MIKPEFVTPAQARQAPLWVTFQDALTQDSQILAAYSFAGEQPQDGVGTGLQVLGGAGPTHEIWRTPEPLTTGESADLCWRATPSLLAASAHVPLADDPVGNTLVLYRRILAGIAKLGYPHLLRIWNYMPRINAGTGDRELYKCFSLGRAQALDECAPDSAALPAATAVGTRSGDRLQVDFIASHEPGRRLENPRQVSAFDYPRRYGPRSPLFSRAALYPGAGRDGTPLLLVSGTASIVGHESRHVGDLNGQLHEIWRNLERVCAEAGEAWPLCLRVYVRHAADYPQIADFVDARLPAGSQAVYLLADICRAELLVEIEGVYRLAAINR